MYEYITGKIIELSPTYVIIDSQGIGYFVNITLNTFTELQSAANTSSVKIFIHTQIREDAHLLYGFKDKAERALFRQLISVSGIGANTARMMLSSMNTGELTTAIAGGDINALKNIKGIGLKTAQRIVVELKDKVSGEPADSEIFINSNNTIQQEALSALVMLGFPKKSAEKVLSDLVKKQRDITVEELIKNALKLL